jgi:acyl carrier protein
MTHANEVTDLTLPVKRVIARYLPDGAEPRSIPDEEPLASLGIDSMRTTDLLLKLESTFGITFPDEVITVEDFRTTANIVRAVSMTLIASQ